MKVRFLQACSFEGVDYKLGGVYDVPESLLKDWYFNALLKDEKIIPEVEPDLSLEKKQIEMHKELVKKSDSVIAKKKKKKGN